jgi:hypothetical protein
MATYVWTLSDYICMSYPVNTLNALGARTQVAALKSSFKYELIFLTKERVRISKGFFTQERICHTKRKCNTNKGGPRDHHHKLLFLLNIAHCRVNSSGIWKPSLFIYIKKVAIYLVGEGRQSRTVRFS